ncbi:hypothetical protein EHI8A_055070 [Entamoeba histolytica HM-1:IMSS-B]|uniref:Transmembrane protein n=6 Tax=Entamoeba histolytica TaxID=5759 RepID=B1N2W2_ENTH1|nr:hypothetical protein EHI_013160 [Entamoeba histolytica HM-1:IMSS]EMD47595.1 Hypothetical protein EHI5A_088690 [Entamoeba histolytica KU27]EMH76685.1 hypothetical protein EHI8A_055070 [Entamoeba histolytica HM-1:IMSS-B]EMS13243.1 hypothetical protein KM1_105530 [Entamoeba histolytica HM-3:IMSS]ENY62687.1 hypothetical protein EHI7A_055040 [Entamoeba histolytica HM-1:IMSS-A]GAT93353.1 hypothetical protein CL6EHI_013160 [Entamoeba histolytica]|eukprot:XP_001913528.1 hypothetical protein EHI_013160 [Entamoeba histolytica HM-1:IMSS]
MRELFFVFFFICLVSSSQCSSIPTVSTPSNIKIKSSTIFSLRIDNDEKVSLTFCGDNQIGHAKVEMYDHCEDGQLSFPIQSFGSVLQLEETNAIELEVTNGEIIYFNVTALEPIDLELCVSIINQNNDPPKYSYSPKAVYFLGGVLLVVIALLSLLVGFLANKKSQSRQSNSSKTIF